MDSDWTPDSSPAAQRWRGTPFLPGDRMPTATEMNALLAAAEARGRAEGWAEAKADMIAALRDQSALLLMLAHYRDSIEGCRCGWADLGKSHSLHVLGVLADYLDSIKPSTEEGTDA